MQLLTPSAEVEEEIKLYIAIVFPLKCILENPDLCKISRALNAEAGDLDSLHCWIFDRLIEVASWNSGCLNT